MPTTKQITEAANLVASEYPIKQIQLFGSYAENRNTPESDVDILVEFTNEATITLLTLCRIKHRMEDILKIPVDIVSIPLPKDSLLEINKVVPLYAA